MSDSQIKRTYTHHVYCNGDRRKPPGTKGVCCSCFNDGSFKAGYEAATIDSQAEVSRLTQELKEARIKLEQSVKCPWCGGDVSDDTSALKGDGQ